MRSSGLVSLRSPSPGDAGADPGWRGRVIDLSGRIALRVSLVVLGVVTVVWLAAQLASVLLLVFVAAILAAGALAPVTWLERRGLPTVAAVVVVYAAVAITLVAVVLLVAPPVVNQVVQLVASLPDLARSLADRYRPLLEPLGLAPDTGSLVDFALNQLRPLAGAVSSIPLAVLGVIGSALSAIFLSVLLLLERKVAREWVVRFVAVDDRELLERLVDQAAFRLGGYIRAQLLIMTITGVGSGLGLFVLGVPFPIALGVVAFLTEAIPIAGPTIAGAVMVGFALIESPEQALATLVLVIALQQLEGLVLVPQIQGRAISISPAVALIAVIAGSTLAGIPGAIIAIPIVAMISVAVDEVVLPWRQREMRVNGTVESPA
ncbi:MAG TPA: AI-2E family transporter [Candidatus Limnocylindrales bacterium]|nr:AI-2E family transporter [Candidatus Limnocylindrales bacterium]